MLICLFHIILLVGCVISMPVLEETDDYNQLGKLNNADLFIT